MESNETLPKGFVQIVDCCKFCIYSDIAGNRQTIGWYSRHDICVMIFSICEDHT